MEVDKKPFNYDIGIVGRETDEGPSRIVELPEGVVRYS